MGTDLAFVLSGGGARGAYQVGVLRALGKHFPSLEPDILCGTSAGAINACYLAGRQESFEHKTEGLFDLWQGLETENIFRTDFPNLFGHVTRWGRALVSGGNSAPMRGLVDTIPLREVIVRALGVKAGKIPGLSENIESGRLKAFAIATTSYTTGQTVLWVQGRQPENYDRAYRRAVDAKLTIRHVMASAAIPIFFPAVRIRGRWYGDGQVRNSTPLSPAVRLGADRILAVSTRYQRSWSEADEKLHEGYPPPAQILGVLMNSIFLDYFDHDASRLRRVNSLLQSLPQEERKGFRPIKMLMMRPSRDLGRMANRFEAKLPRAFRFLTRGLGTREVRANDALSVVMFQSNYLQEVIKVGEYDVERRLEEIKEFLEVPPGESG